jgi:hypothetical protein
MSTSNILQLACDVADEVGLTRPISLFGPADEGDTSDVKLRRALLKTSRFIHRYWNWPVVTNEHSFTSGANGVQTGALPADFDRIVKGSMINLNQRSPISITTAPPVLFPDSSVPLRATAVVRGKQLLLYSQFPSSATIQYSYVRDWIAEHVPEAGPSTFGPSFTTDSDRSLFDDEVMHVGMVWALQDMDGHGKQSQYEAFRDAIHERMTHESPDGVVDFGASGNSDGMNNYPTTPWGQ